MIVMILDFESDMGFYVIVLIMEKRYNLEDLAGIG